MSAAPPVAALAPLPVRRSLRAKGFLATMALLAYLLASVAYVSSERGRIYDSVQTLQQLARHEQLVAGLELARKAIRNLRQAENAAVAAYTAGNGDFDSILNLESRLLESRRSLVRAVYEIQAVRARIDRIVARPIEEQIEQAEGWS